jgi:small subunit ribosomal protein S15
MKEQFKKHSQDTGSIEVQIAQLTTQIEQLTSHFKSNPKDFASKNGLIKMVSKRRRFLKYLKKENEESYKKLMKRIEHEEVV